MTVEIAKLIVTLVCTAYGLFVTGTIVKANIDYRMPVGFWAFPVATLALTGGMWI